MFRILLAASAALTLSYLPVSAATASYLGSGWGDLNALCGGADCTLGVAEMRAGNYSLNTGEREITVGENTDTSSQLNGGQFAWADNQPVAFSITGTTTSLALSIDGAQPNPVTYNLDLSTADGIVLRGAGYNGGKVGITDLIVNGMNLGDFTFDGGAAFYHLTGFDATNFTATGSIFFDYDTPTPNNQQRSNLAVQFKVVDTPAPVPLPAAVWMLGAGVLGLVGVGRRRANA